MARKPSLPQPDAWMRLVLQYMSIEELRREILQAAPHSNERRWLQEELAKKERAAQR